MEPCAPSRKNQRKEGAEKSFSQPFLNVHCLERQSLGGDAGSEVVAADDGGKEKLQAKAAGRARMYRRVIEHCEYFSRGMASRHAGHVPASIRR